MPGYPMLCVCSQLRQYGRGRSCRWRVKEGNLDGRIQKRNDKYGRKLDNTCGCSSVISSFSFNTRLFLRFMIEGPSEGSMLFRANSSKSNLSTSFPPAWYSFS